MGAPLTGCVLTALAWLEQRVLERLLLVLLGGVGGWRGAHQSTAACAAFCAALGIIQYYIVPRAYIELDLDDDGSACLGHLAQFVLRCLAVRCGMI